MSRREAIYAGQSEDGSLENLAVRAGAGPYLDPGRAQLLDHLQHLIDSSALLLLVLGPAGRGKSTLAAELRAVIGGRHRVCDVEADNDLSAGLLLRRLAVCFGLGDEASGNGAALERALVERGQQAVVLVDDAQRLPPVTLDLLLSFAAAAGNPQTKPVRVVLFSDDSLRAQIGASSACVHRLPISALTLPQTAEYVSHRLRACGEQAHAERIQTFIKQIHRRSGGNPGAIDAQLVELIEGGHALRGVFLLDEALERFPMLARFAAFLQRVRHATSAERLFAFARRPTGETALPWAPAWAAAKAHPTVVAGAVVAALLVAIALLLLIRGGNDAPMPDTIVTVPDIQPIGPPLRAGAPSAQDSQTPGAVLELAPPVAGDPAGLASTPEEEPGRASMVDREPVPEEVPEIGFEEQRGPVSDAEPAVAPPLATDSVPTQGPESAPEPAPARRAAQDAVIERAPPVAGTEAPVAPVVARRQSAEPVRGAEWLAQRKPEHYTLQLLAGSNLDALNAYAARRDLRGDVAIIPGTRGGAPWHILIFGDFPDRAAAQQASAQLRPHLDEAPWLRRMDGLLVGLQAATAAPQPSPPYASNSASPNASPNASQAAPTSAPATGSSGRGSAWLWAQDPRSYTLQLVGSRSEAVVRQLIVRHELERDATYFVTDYNGRPWYVLIYGSYPSPAEARAAAAGLPQALLEGSPWPRAFGDIQRLVTLD